MRNKIFKYIVLLSLPLVLKYLFFLVFVDWDVFDKNDGIEDVIFFGLITVLAFTKLFQNTIFRNLLILFYVFYVVLETTSYLAVSSTFSSSYMYLLLESGNEELKEFANGYLSLPIVIVFFVNIGLFFMLIKNKLKTKYQFANWFGILGLVLITGFLKLSGFIESNAYHNVVRGTYGYYQLQKDMVLNTEIEKSDLQITAKNEVLVLVLGESTDRNHMQIYGYKKETNPLLASVKDSLYIYDNVISTDVFTLKAVPKILTSLSDESDGNLIDVIQVFKTAGYDTYWLSNQRPISFHDNAISKIASGSTEFKFYNHLIDRDTKVLDEILLPDYQNILDKPGKKVIVLRLIGTHFDYDNRYPDDFNTFDKNNNISKKERLRNQYNNAILYNDFIVYTILSKLKAKNQKSALLYVSDHGENIYNNGTDFFGRSEEIVTQSMFEIPFMLWTSNSFEKPHDFQFQKNRSFTSQYTYESLGHIFGVMHNTMKIENSIFSTKYKPKKRIIVGERDFDTYFNLQE